MAYTFFKAPQACAPRGSPNGTSESRSVDRARAALETSERSVPAMLDTAGMPRDISTARFGPESTRASRLRLAPSAESDSWRHTSRLSKAVPVSSPLVASTTRALLPHDESTARATSLKAPAGTAMIQLDALA